MEESPPKTNMLDASETATWPDRGLGDVPEESKMVQEVVSAVRAKALPLPDVVLPPDNQDENVEKRRM